MRLKVPEFEQEDEKGCGAAALQMVLEYYGEEISQKEIIERHGGLTKLGSFTLGLGSIAADIGFKVKCYSYFLYKMKHEDFNKNGEEMIALVEEKIKRQEDDFWKKEFKAFKRFLEKDLDLKFVIPKISEIKKYLNRRVPVILAVNSASLFENDSDLEKGHFIVITGFKGDKFFINDPEGEINQLSEDKLLFSLSNNVLKSSAYMLVIEDK